MHSGQLSCCEAARKEDRGVIEANTPSLQGLESPEYNRSEMAA